MFLHDQNFLLKNFRKQITVHRKRCARYSVASATAVYSVETRKGNLLKLRFWQKVKVMRIKTPMTKTLLYHSLLYRSRVSMTRCNFDTEILLERVEMAQGGHCKCSRIYGTDNRSLCCKQAFFASILACCKNDPKLESGQCY